MKWHVGLRCGHSVHGRVRSVWDLVFFHSLFYGRKLSINRCNGFVHKCELFFVDEVLLLQFEVDVFLEVLVYVGQFFLIFHRFFGVIFRKIGNGLI